MSLSPLRLVHVASGDLWAGAEVQLYYLARALRQRGDVELHVVLLNHGALEERLRAAQVPVEVLDEQRLNSLRLVRALRARLTALRPQVVHSHRYKENLLTALAARGLGCIAVRSIHSAFRRPDSWRARAARFADLVAARLQQGAVCVSPELLEQVHTRYPALQLEVIENGIDVEELNAAARIETPPLGDGTRLHIGLVGRLVPIKRPDLFVAIAHHLVQDLPGRFAFHLFGDGSLQRECEEFVARHGLQADVHLHGFRANLPAWLARLDALVICSDHEGLPMVLLEAMALGVPVVAHAVGGMPQVLGLGEYGALVREQAMDDYAEALRQLAARPAAFRDRARRARDHVQLRYSIATAAERYLAFYRRLLTAPAGQGGVVYD